MRVFRTEDSWYLLSSSDFYPDYRDPLKGILTRKISDVFRCILEVTQP